MATEEAKMNKWWVQTLITIAIVLAGMSIAWGAYSTKVGQLEKKVEQLQPDHDLLIALNTKMDLVMKSLDEVRADVKKYMGESHKGEVANESMGKGEVAKY